MNKDNMVPAIVLLISVFVIGGILYWARPKTTQTPVVANQESVPANAVVETSPTPSSTDSVTNDSNVKKFTVTGSNFSFDVKEIKVKKGDKVEIKFVNADGFHDWVLDEFNAKTKQFKAPGEETITFVADKTGTYEYYCSVGSHRQMGMVGKFIVEE
jgi:plastocyanin